MEALAVCLVTMAVEVEFVVVEVEFVVVVVLAGMSPNAPRGEMYVGAQVAGLMPFFVSISFNISLKHPGLSLFIMCA